MPIGCADFSLGNQSICANEPQNKKMRANFKIETVPHIVKVFPDGTRSVYKGKRKCNDIIEWAYETTYDC